MTVFQWLWDTLSSPITFTWTRICQRAWQCCRGRQKRVSELQQVFPSLPHLCASSSSLAGLAHIHLQTRQNLALSFLCKTAKFCISCSPSKSGFFIVCVKVWVKKKLAQLGGKHKRNIISCTILAATTGNGLILIIASRCVSTVTYWRV